MDKVWEVQVGWMAGGMDGRWDGWQVTFNVMNVLIQAKIHLIHIHNLIIHLRNSSKHMNTCGEFHAKWKSL